MREPNSPPPPAAITNPSRDTQRATTPTRSSPEQGTSAEALSEKRRKRSVAGGVWSGVGAPAPATRRDPNQVARQAPGRQPDAALRRRRAAGCLAGERGG